MFEEGPGVGGGMRARRTAGATWGLCGLVHPQVVILPRWCFRETGERDLGEL